MHDAQQQPSQEAAHRAEDAMASPQAGVWVFSVHWLLLSLLLLSLPAVGASQELVTRNPYKVEAAYLRNFAHYVTWPSHAFSKDTESWNICVLGPDPFGDVLETTLEGRTEQGKSFTVFRATRLEDLPPCQIIFIAFKETRKRRDALNALKDKPVLTVGEATEFLNEGGIIRFEVDHRVSMGINLDQSRKALLDIQTKMLEVSKVILENGEVHHMR